VLIFSQMVRVLAIIEDYLVHREYPFMRLDGGVAETERQTAIEHFNVDEHAFIFLLSTRAGGVGINLTAADTVIIYDSDWNPQNDIQAQARCHRIGQKATVKVCRLITRGTYEQKMFERASRKLGLDHVVLDGGEMARDARPMKASEIEEMLRNGVHGIFNDDDTEADRFCADDIDQILERRAKVCTSDVISGGGSIFAKASFDGEANNIDLDAADFWSQVLPASHSARFQEQVVIRRCREQKLEIAVRTDMADGVQASKRVVQAIADRGFRGGRGEVQVIRYAMRFCEVADARLAPLLTQVVGRESAQRTAEAIGGEAAWLIEERSDKIIEQTLFFARLRRALSFVQDAPVEWPAVVPLWQDPVAEYALALAVDRYGWRDLPANIGAPELGLERARPLKKPQIQRRLSDLIDGLEGQMPTGLLAPPESFEPALPARWRDAHAGIRARELLVDHEVAAVLHALLAVGAPADGDWTEVRDLAGLGIVAVAAVRAVGEQLIALATCRIEKPDFALYPLLEPARERLCLREMRLQLALKEMREVRAFAAELNGERAELLRKLERPSHAPGWWAWECDRALILSVARHGRLKVAMWVIDRSLPFRRRLPAHVIEPLERAAEQEGARPTKVRLSVDIPDELAYLFRERSRLARCTAVIGAVDRMLVEQPEAPPRAKKGKGGFPMVVWSGMMLVSVGRLVVDNVFYDSMAATYPVGFCTERSYKAARWPSRARFRSEILEGDGRPLFRVTCLTGPIQVFTTGDPSEAWRQAIEAVGRRFNQDPEKGRRVYGNALFGLLNKKVVDELLKLENASRMHGLHQPVGSAESQSTSSQPFEFPLPLFLAPP
jgi:chromodomain-helicase-DNA-binding protein 7